MANRLEKTVNVTPPPEAPGGGSGGGTGGGSGGGGGGLGGGGVPWTCADTATAAVRAMFPGPGVLVGASNGSVTAYRNTPSGTALVAIYGYSCANGSLTLNSQPFGFGTGTGGSGGVG